MTVYWKDNPSGFAIEVIEALWTEGTFHIDEYGGDHEEWKAECDALIDEVNATEVRPDTHAHWIKSETEPYACSNCNRRELWMNAVTYEYCPHCGARMDEEVQ